MNPATHGEGNVLAHTKMVCGALAADPAFHELPEPQRTALFLAAVFHDFGKVQTGAGKIPRADPLHHGSAGSRAVRAFLWKECGLSGKPESIAFRETVCALIRYHLLPYRLDLQKDPGRAARTAAAVGEKVPGFTWRLLCMLAEADMKGRIADDIEERIRKIRQARETAEEAGCPDHPAPFPDSFTKRAYFSGRTDQPGCPVPDDTGGEVVMLSGLPGTGKDRWIRENVPELPMISLDGIRAETGISPTEPQEEVFRLAGERAGALLESRQPFVWNATNLTREVRQERIGLFERYGARVKVVYLETEWDTRIARNRGRKAPEVVPEEKVGAMLEGMSLPMADEAGEVEWICV